MHNFSAKLPYKFFMKVVVTRTRKKIISLNVDENGVLQVLANNKLSLDKIKTFVESKRDWVTSRLQQEHSPVEDSVATSVAANSNVMSQRTIADMFSGKLCMLCGEILSVRPTVESKCYLDGNSILIPEKYYVQKDTRLKALRSYVKKISIQTVSEKISRFGSAASLCPTRIEFRALPNGWVKCTNPSERIISLDFRVCQLPDVLQHYVIVHAFSHFVNDGHSQVFWNTVSNYLPRYRSCVEELKRYDFLKDV